MPVSDKQLAANRANSKKSTGPRTAEGRRKVSRNAVTHSLTARRPLVLPNQQEAYDILAGSLRAEVQPWGALEHDAFEQLLVAAWQLRISDEYQAAISSYSASTETRLEQLERITRLRGALERSYQRAWRRLRELQSTRAAEADLSVTAALNHSLNTPVAPLKPPEKQSHFYSEDTPDQWLKAFSNPAIFPLLPYRTLVLIHRVISRHPGLAEEQAQGTPPAPEAPTV